jgi:hypothetical protein
MPVAAPIQAAVRWCGSSGCIGGCGDLGWSQWQPRIRRGGGGRLGVRINQATELRPSRNRCGSSRSERGALLEEPRRGARPACSSARCCVGGEGPGYGGAGPQPAAERPDQRRGKTGEGARKGRNLTRGAARSERGREGGAHSGWR